ncbi:MAG: hypothetical protein BWX54_01714 [Verrucomicrobia bacterium ADurb.Bin018]|nr:MAG: hypothetical protein BWX54_01714 [Verrucomicrobia bacterium ADurb.Bin018]
MAQVFIFLDAGGAVIQFTVGFERGFRAQFRQVPPHRRVIADDLFHTVGGADDLSQLVGDRHNIGDDGGRERVGIERAAIACARDQAQEAEIAAGPIQHVAGVETKGIIALLGRARRIHAAQVAQRVAALVIKRRVEDLLPVEVEEHFRQAVHVFVKIVQPQIQQHSGGVVIAAVREHHAVFGLHVLLVFVVKEIVEQPRITDVVELGDQVVAVGDVVPVAQLDPVAVFVNELLAFFLLFFVVPGAAVVGVIQPQLAGIIALMRVFPKQVFTDTQPALLANVHVSAGFEGIVDRLVVGGQQERPVVRTPARGELEFGQLLKVCAHIREPEERHRPELETHMFRAQDFVVLQRGRTRPH